MTAPQVKARFWKSGILMINSGVERWQSSCFYSIFTLFFSSLFLLHFLSFLLFLSFVFNFNLPCFYCSLLSLFLNFFPLSLFCFCLFCIYFSLLFLFFPYNFSREFELARVYCSTMLFSVLFPSIEYSLQIIFKLQFYL